MKKITFFLLTGIVISIAAFIIAFPKAPPKPKPYVIAILQGQLGNQMFEIAATVSLALDHEAIPIFPDLTINSGEGIPLNYQKVFPQLYSFIPREKTQFLYVEPSLSYSPIPYQPNMALRGYFQSEKYFRHHKDEIRKLFAPSQEIVSYLKEKYAHILDHPNSVGVHVRCYKKDDPQQKIYPQYGREYYEKAMMKFPEDALFVVCSNRIEWCKEIFSGIARNIIYIENEPHYHDFYLMSFCKHNIIANSSFSWWAAYLNENMQKVVLAPPHWYTKRSGLDYKDIVPEGWVIVE